MGKIKRFITNEFLAWNAFEACLLIVSITLILISSLAFTTSTPAWQTTLSIFAGISGVVGVILGAKGKISAFFVATINSLLYIIIALTTKMYSSSILHLVFYIPMNIIGFSLWFKKRDRDGNVLVKNMSVIGFVTVICASVVVWAIYLPVIFSLINAEQPFILVLDALILVATILAIFLMTFRYVEQWYLWLLSNILNVIIWIVNLIIHAKKHQQGAIPQDVVMIIAFSASLVNSIYGFVKWLKLKQDNEVFIFDKLTINEYNQLKWRSKLSYKLNLFFTKKVEAPSVENN